MKLNIVKLESVDIPVPDQQTSAATSSVSATPQPANTSLPPPIAAPSFGMPGESEWIFSKVENLNAMCLAAQKGRNEAIQQLIRIAEELCPDVLDKLQRDTGSVGPAPAHIAETVIGATKPMLKLARLVQQTDASQVQALAQELTTLRSENASLLQRATSAENALRVFQEEKLRAEQRRYAEAEKRSRALMEKNRARERHDDKRYKVEDTALPNTAISAVEAQPQNALVVEPSLPNAPVNATSAPEATASEARVESLIRLVAQTGITRSREIRDRLAVEVGVANGKSMQGVIITAAIRKLIEVITVSNEYVGAGNVSMVCLTDAGKKKAVNLGLQVVKSQYELGMAQHKSAEQTYAILDLADILRECGYADVDPFPRPLRFGVMEYRPDVTAINPDTNETLLIEYERPTFKNSDDGSRTDKWMRASQFNNGVVYLATPNRDTLESILAEIRQQAQRADVGVPRVLGLTISDYRKSGDQRGNRLTLWKEAWQPNQKSQ